MGSEQIHNTELHRVTMKDIAEQLGVSVNTVHKVITGKAGVGEATRAKVLACADKLGYRRNEVASSLRRKDIHVLVCLPSALGSGRYFSAALWDGCKRYVEEMRDAGARCELIPFDFGDYESQLEAIIQRIENQEKIDGMLAYPPATDKEIDLLRQISEHGIALELVNGDNPTTKRIGAVVADFSTAGRLMAEQAYNLLRGSTDGARVLLMTGDPYTDSHYLMARAFHACVDELGAPFEVEDLPGAHKQTDKLRKQLAYNLQHEPPQLICSVFAVGSEILAAELEKAGLARKIPAIGNDLFDESIEALKAGTFTNLVYKDPAGMAYKAAQRLGEYVLWGTNPKPVVETGSVELVFKSNLSQYC